MGSPEILFPKLNTRYGFLRPCCTRARNAILWDCALNSGIYLSQLPAFWKDWSPTLIILETRLIITVLYFLNQEDHTTEGKTRSADSTPFLHKNLFKQGASLKNLLSCAFIYADAQSRRKVLRAVMGQIWCPACTCRIRDSLLLRLLWREMDVLQENEESVILPSGNAHTSICVFYNFLYLRVSEENTFCLLLPNNMLHANRATAFFQSGMTWCPP